MNHALRIVLIVALFGALAACITQPSWVQKAPGTTPTQALSAVFAAAQVDDRELNIHPIRDPQIEDLRTAAANFQQKGDWKGAATALDQALSINPNDPAVLQERAEIALAQGQWERAEMLSRKALSLGSNTGPLCRRHWATIEQVQLAHNQLQNAATARAQITNCTVPGIERM